MGPTMRGVKSAFPVYGKLASHHVQLDGSSGCVRASASSARWTTVLTGDMPAETETDMGKCITRVTQARRYLVARNVAITQQRHTPDSWICDGSKANFTQNHKFVPCSSGSTSCTLVPNREQDVDKPDHSGDRQKPDQSALEGRDNRSRRQSVKWEEMHSGPGSPSCGNSGERQSLGTVDASSDDVCGEHAFKPALRQPGDTWRERRIAHGQ